MRFRGHGGSLSHLPEDKSQRFMLGRIALYMDRLLAHYPRPDENIFQMLHWLLGSEIIEEDLVPLAVMLNAGARKRGLERDIEEEIRSSRDFGYVMDQALSKIHSKEKAAVIDLLRGLLEKRMNQLRCGTSDIEKNLDALHQMFGLTELEKEICLFFLILSLYEEAQNLFEYHLRCDHYSGSSYLATILDTKSTETWKTVHGKLAHIGILEPHSRNVALEPDFLRFLQNTSEADINTEFFKKIEPDVIPLDSHAVEREVTEHALRLLSPENRNGCSIILFGNPGVGKTTYAYGLAEALGLDTFLCKHAGKEKQWQRQAPIMASVNMASHNKDSLLIIDDCDAILGTQHLWSLFGAYNDKKWLHEILESEAKVIFIVNDTRFFEASVIRRFSFSIHFKPFSRDRRILLWKNLLESQKLGLVLTDAQISHLATAYDVSAGVIEQAVRKAVEIGSGAEDDLYKSVLLSLEAHENLVQGGHKPRRQNSADKHLVLDGLNVIGTDPHTLLEDLRALERHAKSGKSELAGCSLLFYGPSGTGKTHLAYHIASILDKEVVSKRGSDLLSPFVGETEARIRAAYDEAASKEAVLVINEAESLVFNRDRAERSWQLSFTNEFLNCMEEYRSIQIFTTNRLSDMDSAALRRFDYKLEFGYLKPEGNLAFYKNLLLSLVGSPLEEGLEDEIKGISCLTPGDFKVVQSKVRFKAPKEVSHKALIAALQEEAKMKEIHGGKRAIGF